MNNVMLNSATMGVVISLMGFFVGLLCREKFKLPIFNPLLIAIIFTIGFVEIFQLLFRKISQLVVNTSDSCVSCTSLQGS